MDLNVLKFVIDNEHEHLIEAVEDSGSTLDAAIGVAKFLIANNSPIIWNSSQCLPIHLKICLVKSGSLHIILYLT